jgi:hypothetical protein
MFLLRCSVVGAVALVAPTLVLPTASHALTFNLTSDHCTNFCGLPPIGTTVFGSVDVTQNGANVDIALALANGLNWAKTGAADQQEFKFNGTGVAFGDISVDQTFAGQTLAPETGDFHGDGTGDFAFGIACTTCGNGNLKITSNIVFHVANATIADLTGQNNNGIVFVADVFSSLTGNTGPVDATPVPAPIVGAGFPDLIFVACGGLLGLARRRRQKPPGPPNSPQLTLGSVLALRPGTFDF